MELIFQPYRNLYAAIAGRSSRTQFWLFTLYYVVGIIAFYALIGGIAAANFFAASQGRINPVAMASSMGSVFLIAIPFSLWIYPTGLAQLALSCRRMHDQNRSSWYLLIGFIPFLGWLVVLILLLLPGTQGANRYGPDPREAETTSAVFS